jgi:hypothetical protein
MGIVFGRYAFSEPRQLITWSPPRLAGLYVIMVEDQVWGPRPARPIYFGETGNFAERGFPFSHHAASEWMKQAWPGQLWVSYLTLPYSDAARRREVERELVDSYNPVCNGAVRGRLLAALLEAASRPALPTYGSAVAAPPRPPVPTRGSALAQLLSSYRLPRNV